MDRPWRFTAVVLGLLLSALALRADDPEKRDPKPSDPAKHDAEGLAFFEQKIRPALVTHCYECHSAQSKTPKGGLLLDSRQGLLTGGDSGPALVVGKPAESLLLQAIKYEGIDMPPKAKLPAEVVANFERWIAMGAPDPREGKALTRGQIDIEAGRKFWSFQPPQRRPAPTVQQADWPRGEVDRYILTRLEQAKLKPVADASRRALIRRLSFDLIGLPPTPAEIEAFEQDKSPDAVERLVDRLLASPQFGERWARHWLDVVRYGESLTLRGFILPGAWRYRDYVIRAFNEDRPYHQFVLEQIAGDLLPANDVDTKQRQRVAVSFLALGNTNLEEQNKKQLRMDVVDEQLDTIGKVFLGQTLGCARCHDHKFDPIPTRDYYALAGILRSTRTLHHANVSKWLETAVPLPPDQSAQYDKADAEINAFESKLQAARNNLTSMIAVHDEQASPNDKPEALPVGDLPGVVVDDAQAKAVGQWVQSTHYRRFVGSGYLHDGNKDKGKKTLTFVPDITKAGKYEVRLAYTSDPNRATSVPVTIFCADGETTVRVNMRQAPDLDGRFVSLGTYQFESNGQGFVIISNEGTDGYVCPDAVQFVPFQSTDNLMKLVKTKFSDNSPEDVRQASDRLQSMEKEMTKLRKDAPKRPTVLTVEEEFQPENARIHARGNVATLGDEVPRGFLQVAMSEPATELPSDESGRRQLGEWLASAKNPLTARVMVNRVWHWLFGAGLVRTTDNFGAAGELPSHPELLDYLATRFVDEGWSIKKLVRELVLSHTYQLATTTDKAALAADPENRLLWRSNRRRLDGECLRDAMLLVSGQLDASPGESQIPASASSDYGLKLENNRRSIYQPILRNALPEVLEVFDLADSSSVTGKRNVSTVAPQALLMMNHPFVLAQAEHAAKLLLKEPDRSRSERVTMIFQRALGREPTPRELEFSEKFVGRLLDEQKVAPEEAWSQVYQAVFSTIDFRYTD
ncbi:MAG: DUF1553 domain-containing protein [Planctomycetes bacterium]|nr:DUF1553 domain-containing protein [Planctomycetota bacterium]